MEDTSREASIAALALASLKHLQPDNETIEDMEKARHEAIRKQQIRLNRLPPVPSMIYRIGNCSQALTKELEDSDVKDNQSRLSLKPEFVKNELLPMLDESYDGNVRDGIQVTAYDSNGSQYEKMVFKLWGKKMFVLTRQWKQFCEKHKLVSKDKAKVWMFRDKYTGKLGFVIQPIFLDIDGEERENRRRVINGRGRRNFNMSS